MTCRAVQAACLLVVAMAVAWAAIEPIKPIELDEASEAPVPGDITGALSPVDRVDTLSLVCRATGESYTTEPDAETGKFVFKGLPGDAAYDLQIITTEGLEFVGIDLSFVDSDIERLAQSRRNSLDIPQPDAEPVTREDAGAICALIAEDKSFADSTRVIYLAANDGRVTVLVEMIRDSEFHGDGDIARVWRTELWYFERVGGRWQRLAKFNCMLDRRKLNEAEAGELAVAYLPALSVTIDRAGESPALTFDIPDTIDPTTGRVGDAPQPPVTPTLLGIDD